MKFRSLYTLESSATSVYSVDHEIAFSLLSTKFVLGNNNGTQMPIKSSKAYLPVVNKIRKVLEEHKSALINTYISKIEFLRRLNSEKKYQELFFYYSNGFSFLHTDIKSFVNKFFLSPEKVTITTMLTSMWVQTSMTARMYQKTPITKSKIIVNGFIDALNSSYCASKVLKCVDFYQNPIHQVRSLCA